MKSQQGAQGMEEGGGRHVRGPTARRMGPWGRGAWERVPKGARERTCCLLTCCRGAPCWPPGGRPLPRRGNGIGFAGDLGPQSSTENLEAFRARSLARLSLPHHQSLELVRHPHFSPAHRECDDDGEACQVERRRGPRGPGRLCLPAAIQRGDSARWRRRPSQTRKRGSSHGASPGTVQTRGPNKTGAAPSRAGEGAMIRMSIRLLQSTA